MRYIMSFSKNLNKLLLIGTVLVGGGMSGNCMEITIDLGNMFENTRVLDNEDTLYTPAVKAAISSYSVAISNIQEIENSLIENANNGNYFAQYYLAEYYGALAKEKQNGEKFALEKMKAILLLVSAVKGSFWRSIEELKFALNGSTEKQLAELKTEIDIEQLATTLARIGKL